MTKLPIKWRIKRRLYKIAFVLTGNEYYITMINAINTADKHFILANAIEKLDES